MSFKTKIPTEFIFGSGSLTRLHRYALPGNKALIVTSSGKSVIENGSLSKVTSGLEKAGTEYCVFSGAEANPTAENVEAGAKMAKEQGCDFVVGLGGGSSMDCAKAIALMAKNEGEMWDYMFGITGGKKVPEGGALPIIAIPTTAGTGSEMNNCAVISNNETKEKLGFVHDAVYPTMAIIDPEVTLSVPPKFTAYQGFDALFHACESVIHRKTHAYGYMHAMKAVELCGKYLERAVRDGSDLEAREGMSLAAAFAGMYMLCTSQHAVEHAMSAFHPKLPHGAGLLMVSDAYWRFIADSHTCDESLTAMAKTMGREDGNFVAALAELRKVCGMDELKMSDYGITEDELSDIAANSKATMGVLFIGDPAKPTVEDIEEILRKSFR